MKPLLSFCLLAIPIVTISTALAQSSPDNSGKSQYDKNTLPDIQHQSYQDQQAGSVFNGPNQSYQREMAGQPANPISKPVIATPTANGVDNYGRTNSEQNKTNTATIVNSGAVYGNGPIGQPNSNNPQ